MSDTNAPLVSVIVPSYNQGQYIKETLDSILSQDYSNLEVLVMDGGSKDTTLDVLKGFSGDSRVRWQSEKDKGQADAINKGFAAAKGAILAWLGSDDTYLPGALTKQVGFLQARPEVDVVYGDAIYTRPDGSRCGSYYAREFSATEMCRLCFIPQPSLFMRRQVYERSGGLDLSLHFALDYEYWLRAMFHSTFAYQRGFVATYRLHEDSKTVSSITNFNPEIEKIVNRALDSAGGLPELAANKDWLRADLHLGLGIACCRAGKRGRALGELGKSLKHRLFRPRQFWFAVYFVLGASAANSLAQSWTRLRSRRAA